MQGGRQAERQMRREEEASLGAYWVVGGRQQSMNGRGLQSTDLAPQILAGRSLILVVLARAKARGALCRMQAGFILG